MPTIETEHRRLALLRYLAEASAHTANSSILRDVLSGFGVPTTFDQLSAALGWLAEHELVTLAGSPELLIATATRRGLDVAAGRAVHPGVLRPSPKA